MNSILKYPSKSRLSAGFTLLEVLVAMAIISLGLIGVFSSLSQMLSSTSLLRDKTLATWIATATAPWSPRWPAMPGIVSMAGFPAWTTRKRFTGWWPGSKARLLDGDPMMQCADGVHYALL